MHKPLIHQSRPSQKCEQCGVEFVNPRPGRPRRFCTKSCAAYARPPESRKGRPRVGRTVSCQQCTADFHLPRNVEAKGKGRFCSRACLYRSHEERRRAGETSNPYARIVIDDDEAALHPTAHPAKTEGRYVILRSHYVWDKAHPQDPVQPGESVHHIDGFKWNDVPENLSKVSHAGHRMIHASVNKRMLALAAELDLYRKRFGAL